MHLIGYIFTEVMVQKLIAGGFNLEVNDHSSQHGFVGYELPLLGGLLEIRFIQDEDAYFKWAKKKTFTPFQQPLNSNISVKSVLCNNSVFEIAEVFDQNSSMEPEFQDYFNMRKDPGVMAVVLHCESLEKFRSMNTPDRAFIHKGAPALLIHLNPSCFDFIIQQKPH
ncbi:MAG: hypothetical protein LW875_10480 [Proteobacteria bacterium]|jgi:hypothetical protein|nr:hypothetical protein [Pseudomonadota bacterium]